MNPAARRKVVIAPDSFKGTVDAAAAAAFIAEGWHAERPADELVLAPMADGGEGTLAALETAAPGARREHVRVTGPDGRRVETWWLRLADGTGAVELASTSGITLMAELAPLDAHTTGFGQAIRAALDAGVERVLLALGSSASTDGGAGMLTALGARFRTGDGRPIAPGGRGLAELRTAELAGLLALPAGGATVLGDVTNPLLGADGAAAVFGPQKGADAETVRRLEDALANYAAVLERAGVRVAPETSGAGAAGGTGYALLAWGARAASGAAAVAEVIGLREAAAGAQLLITGEGRYDRQSAAGKVPSEVVRIARAVGAPVALVAGSVSAPSTDFAAAISLSELAGSTAAARSDAPRWLRRAGAELAARQTGAAAR
ncbi:glycerate kinase [Agromyces mediolanus]|uniref:glycerate kinase n=1 Tax=Agromyces mediolanus TaxID=41986 RepID=UPI0038355149